MSAARTMSSEYMHWAKTRQRARYTLAVSGIVPVTAADLGVGSEDVELTGSPGYGFSPLREAIAAHHGVGPDRVATATGTSGANHLAMAALIEPGDEVVIEDPGYEPIAALAAHLGARLRPLARSADDGFGIDAEATARAVTPRTRLIVVSNLHNPTSAALRAPELEALGEAAARAGARVLVDEVYRDAAFESAPPTAASLGDRFVVTSSLTKVYGLGGLRAGWIVAAPDLCDRMLRLKDLFGVNDPHPAERLALAAWRKLPELAARARRILDANRAAWDAFVAGRPEGIEPLPSTEGTTVFPRVLRGDGDALARLLRERYETSIVPGRFFGTPDRVRIGVCGDSAELREGLDRLGRALGELAAGRA